MLTTMNTLGVERAPPVQFYTWSILYLQPNRGGRLTQNLRPIKQTNCRRIINHVRRED
ncbi:hypothetical protein [Richelia intracellularis]|jgi:hypothetical protein|uniref:hypothetical protein n=1 Tax=Richelia intracellularis TaxID=1164990 RepID=UPI000347DD3E|nr:hypothetical protein [Richelia intracellularis]